MMDTIRLNIATGEMAMNEQFQYMDLCMAVYHQIFKLIRLSISKLRAMKNRSAIQNELLIDLIGLI